MIASPPRPAHANAVLAGVVDLLTPESAWTQGADARDAQGQALRALDCRAVAWCMVGAARRCAGEWWSVSPEYHAAISALADACAALRAGGGLPEASPFALAGNTFMVEEFNDRASHAWVLAACRGAQAVADVLREGERP